MKNLNRGYGINPDGSAWFAPWLEYLPDNAFAGMQALKTAHIPGHVLDVGAGAFENCTRLKKVTIEEGVEYLDMRCFAGCTSLKRVVLPDSADIGNYGFLDSGIAEPVFNRSKTKLFFYPNTLTSVYYRVPSTVRCIGLTVFGQNPYLKEVILPEGVRELSIRAFCDSRVERVVLPSSLNVDKVVFENCPNLREVVIGDGTQIGEDAFSGTPEDMQMKKAIVPSADPHSFFRFPFSATSPDAISLPLYHGNGDRHTDSQHFQHIAKHAVEDQNPTATLQMVDIFLALNQQRPHEFYRFGAYFWEHMAFAARHGAPIKLGSLWKNASRGIPQACSGRFLNYLGFSFFDPQRVYLAWNQQRPGYILVYSPRDIHRDWNSMDTMYDWYYLTEDLVLISEAYVLRNRVGWEPTDWAHDFRLMRRSVERALKQGEK